MARKAAKAKKEALPAEPADPLRVIGLLFGWVVGGTVGWQQFQQSDLLEAAIRGAAAFVGVTVVWMLGVALCEQIFAAAKSAEVERKAAEAVEEQQPTHA
jgi:hypothetical protein